MFWALVVAVLIAVAAMAVAIGLYGRLAAERAGSAERIRLLREQFQGQFQTIAADALERNNRQFLELANCDLARRQQAIDEMVKPLRESLAKVDTQIRAIEVTRAGAYASLTDQVKSMAEETRKLSGALKSPNARGRWGEMQLRRVAELAGMTANCDFFEQVTVAGEDGRMRPDMIVRLPNGREVVVDSKVSLAAYLESLEAPTEAAAAEKRKQHAQQVRKHIERLGQKSYASHFEQAPDFVIAFLPGEIFFSAALEQQPDLIEYGVRNNVVLATPTTLIALLRAIAYGWRESQLARNAEEIRALGAELYDRIRVFAEHYSEVGSALNKAVGAYNKGRSSLDSRLLSTARRFEDLGVECRREVGEVIAIDAAALAPTYVKAGQ